MFAMVSPSKAIPMVDHMPHLSKVQAPGIQGLGLRHLLVQVAPEKVCSPEKGQDCRAGVTDQVGFPFGLSLDGSWRWS